MKWSHSRLSRFRTCPRAFQLEYELGVGGEPSKLLEDGRAVHEMIERYGNHCYANKLDADQSMGQTIAGMTESKEAQVQFMRFLDRQIWDFEGLLGGPDDKLFETWHEAELPDGLGLYRGKVDFCTLNDGELRVLDYKSGPRSWDPPDQPELPTLQLLSYAWLLVQQFGESVETIMLQQEWVASGYVWSWEIGLGDLLDVEEALCGLVRDVLAAREKYFVGTSRDGNTSDDWPREYGTSCQYCGHRDDCAKAYCAAEGVTPQDLLDMDCIFGAAASFARKQLKEHVADHGPFTDRTGATHQRYEKPGKWLPRKGKLPELYALLVEAKLDADKIVLSGDYERYCDPVSMTYREPIAKLCKQNPKRKEWAARRIVIGEAEEAARIASGEANDGD